MTIYYGEHPLLMMYTDEELRTKIGEFIADKIKDGSKYFSYKGLCNILFRCAQSENKLKTEKDATYNNPVLAYDDATRISRLLWERIWNREIFIDFCENNFAATYHEDTYFGII